MTPPAADNGFQDTQKVERETQHSMTANNPSMASMSSTRGVRSEDSWIEIPSRPSSSSLSSTSNNIITTGLQIRPQDDRVSRGPQLSQISSSQPRSTSATGSSQDEYEESSSDSDRVMSSSNEDISQDENVDDDDTATALGVGSMNKVFTPQPNAFSHPPSSHGQGQPIPDSYFPALPSTILERPANQRTVTQRSYQRQNQSRHRTYTSSYQPDHDAALRASLTTLLSCAAAVRPKGSESRPATTVPRPSTQPTALRLVPESELDPARQRPRRTSSPPKQTKRKSRESSKERHVKKVRAAKATMTNDELISPTLASWMISAGVVLVFSAISFSAGYAWGKEVGRIEGEMGLPGGSCGREALRGSGSGLRRLRWTAAPSNITA
ncbi:hypothetical protein EDD36DRAFT_282763 [Exophiala viscosa]|uniref:Uncharacterized protein n=1 Tax=Exophiala viscosa TaxID=2486360 RepID=A0AAN6ICT0_9EURO|nr:hypothetical protein EDD36DRAFT_282763 [Exophiala viscosa]